MSLSSDLYSAFVAMLPPSGYGGNPDPGSGSFDGDDWVPKTGEFLAGEIANAFAASVTAVTLSFTDTGAAVAAGGVYAGSGAGRPQLTSSVIGVCGDVILSVFNSMAVLGQSGSSSSDIMGVFANGVLGACRDCLLQATLNYTSSGTITIPGSPPVVIPGSVPMVMAVGALATLPVNPAGVSVLLGMSGDDRSQANGMANGILLGVLTPNGAVPAISATASSAASAFAVSGVSAPPAGYS